MNSEEILTCLIFVIIKVCPQYCSTNLGKEECERCFDNHGFCLWFASTCGSQHPESLS